MPEMAEICNCHRIANWLFGGNLVAIWWQFGGNLVASLFLRNFAGSCEFKLAGQQAWLADSLAMFCGLASRLTQSLAPKHAVSPVASHEPQATVVVHAKVAGRPIFHKPHLA